MAAEAVRGCGRAGYYDVSGLDFTVLTAVFEPEAFPVHLQNVDIMGHSIKQCAFEAL